MAEKRQETAKWLRFELDEHLAVDTTRRRTNTSSYELQHSKRSERLKGRDERHGLPRDENNTIIGSGRIPNEHSKKVISLSDTQLQKKYLCIRKWHAQNGEYLHNQQQEEENHNIQVHYLPVKNLNFTTTSETS